MIGRFVGAATLLACMGLAVAVVPPAVAAPATCADVLVVGARASGQPQAGDGGDAGTGLGAQVHAAARILQRRLPGASVETVAVQYPAAPVTLLGSDPAAYFAGLEQGVAWTEQRLADAVASCPDQRLVLMGYSQGAMVMHRVVQDLVSSGSAGRGVLARLDGAVLLADGDRDATDGTRRWGSARKGVGLARQYGGLSGARTVALPRSVARLVQSVCDRGDRVCDVTGASGAGVGTGDVHTTHYRASAPVRKAVTAVVGNVRASVATRHSSNALAIARSSTRS